MTTRCGQLDCCRPDVTGVHPKNRLVYLACSRRLIQQCFGKEKDELGLDHLEVRCWKTAPRYSVL